LVLLYWASTSSSVASPSFWNSKMPSRSSTSRASSWYSSTHFLLTPILRWIDSARFGSFQKLGSKVWLVRSSISLSRLSTSKIPP
jgi:hypothetical protein